ncbi:MAG: S-formylglutathione hydrolase [Gammaproteobacteria bacterium]|jgi:S-formylglutathione hydrolase
MPSKKGLMFAFVRPSSFKFDTLLGCGLICTQDGHRFMSLQTISEQKCFGGIQGFYTHQSQATGTPMRFSVFLPSVAKRRTVPVVYYLAGLTCTEETATIKAGAQIHAERLGLALVMPDTSPRGTGIAGEDDDWDFGTGAGFYLDATREPWSAHYNMYHYVSDELKNLVESVFPIDNERTGIFGHSMGGHGALTIALKNPFHYASVSAFAPICAPMRCAWGEKAFSHYLGDDRDEWKAFDACELIAERTIDTEILIDQGQADQFLDEQLHPHLFQQACLQAGQALTLRYHAGYDHSYYFIQTFIAEHMEHHARHLAHS